MPIGKTLTRRQAEFVREYLVDLNATAAYRRAGYSARRNAAEVNAVRLLRNAKVAAAIDKAMAERAVRIEITQDRVAREIAKIAFFDVREIFDKDGVIKPISEMDRDTAAAIVSLEVAELGGEQGGIIRKVRLADKLRALELIGKHLGMFRDKLEISGDAANPLSVLIRQIQGSALLPVRPMSGVQAPDA